jgi:hypothetical protein
MSLFKRCRSGEKQLNKERKKGEILRQTLIVLHGVRLNSMECPVQGCSDLEQIL